MSAIKNWRNGNIIAEDGAVCIKELVEIIKANLRRADLRGADLYGADLRGADLSGANLSGTKYGENGTLIKFFTIGPIGSRNDYLQVFVTDKQTIVKTGCFSGGIEEFKQRFSKKDHNTMPYKEYKHALSFIIDIVTTYKSVEKKA